MRRSSNSFSPTWSSSPSAPSAPAALPELLRSFADSDFHIRRLIVEIMATSALTVREGKKP